MPTDYELLAAATAASSEQANQIKNREHIDRVNAENRAFAEATYAKQRADALADWERNNQYNAPVQQMNRLRQAGLNPNLVYGKGADNTATMARASNSQLGNAIAPRIDTLGMGGMLAKYIQLKQIKTQTDNVEANTSTAKMEAALKGAQTAQLAASTATTAFELDKSKALMDSQVKQAQLNNELTQSNITNLQQQTNINLDRNEREQLSNSANVQKTLQEILTEKLKQAQIEQSTKRDVAQTAVLTQDIDNMKEALKNMQKEGALKQWDVEQRAKGIYPNDPFYFRHFMNTFGKDSLIYEKGAMWPK